MATQHLTDDDLILHYYGETSPGDERQIAGHLQQCGLCRAEYTRLQRVLASIDERSVTVDPGAAFFAGRALSPAPAAATEAAVAAAADQIRERILLSDVGEHLDRSQMALVELVSGDDSTSVDFANERSR